jgi:ligand-binding SRPBCC domain-containing protein
MSLRKITDKIEIHAPVDKVFEYFTDTDQLAKHFPAPFKLEILDRTSRHLTQSSSIAFCVRALGIPFKWKSYVHSLSTKRHIAYSWQRNLFFPVWEHDYYFENLPANKTRITECVLYRLPFGFLGVITDFLFIRPMIKYIFNFRRKVLISTLSEEKKSIRS